MNCWHSVSADLQSVGDYRSRIVNLLQRDNEMLQIGLDAFMADREIFTMFAIGNNDDE